MKHIKKGFTLIELLVVILILGILVAVALPAYLSSIKDARTKTANTNARAIATAVQSLYVQGGGAAYAVPTAGTIGADMGGAIPTNPCNGLATIAGAAGAVGYSAVLTGTTKIDINATAGTNCNATETYTLGQ